MSYVTASPISALTGNGHEQCDHLDLNDERRAEQFIQKSRQRWVESGLHPPGDDPQQSG